MGENPSRSCLLGRPFTKSEAGGLARLNPFLPLPREVVVPDNSQRPRTQQQKACHSGSYHRLRCQIR